jgi:Rod binding domain-containing protein
MIKNISDKNSLQPIAAQNTNEKKRDPKMLEAAKSFENQFVRQLISEMRKTVPKDELLPESMTEDIFKEQLDGEYADKWVQNGGIGLADIIYDQLEQRYGAVKQIPPAKGEIFPLPKTTAGGPSAQLRDIFSRADKDLFVAKKGPNGFDIRSREPLPERVDIRSPLSGLVLQATILDEGRQLVVIKHDEGLVSQFVHTGRNNVKSNTRVAAGDVIAELPPSQKGESANVFFGLRRPADLE